MDPDVPRFRLAPSRPPPPPPPYPNSSSSYCAVRHPDVSCDAIAERWVSYCAARHPDLPRASYFAMRDPDVAWVAERGSSDSAGDAWITRGSSDSAGDAWITRGSSDSGLSNCAVSHQKSSDCAVSHQKKTLALPKAKGLSFPPCLGKRARTLITDGSIAGSDLSDCAGSGLSSCAGSHQKLSDCAVSHQKKTLTLPKSEGLKMARTMRGSYPECVMLDCYIRHGVEDSYCVDLAFESTSAGDLIGVGFTVVPPPGISRLVFDWIPARRKNRVHQLGFRRDGDTAKVVAAHYNYMLLRFLLPSKVGLSEEFFIYKYDVAILKRLGCCGHTIINFDTGTNIGLFAVKKMNLRWHTLL